VQPSLTLFIVIPATCRPLITFCCALLTELTYSARTRTDSKRPTRSPHFISLFLASLLITARSRRRIISTKPRLSAAKTAMVAPICCARVRQERSLGRCARRRLEQSSLDVLGDVRCFENIRHRDYDVSADQATWSFGWREEWRGRGGRYGQFRSVSGRDPVRA
jgi:hypothetical protein